MNENFEIICGVSPQNKENLNFQVSDPNFVFENDPLFETVVLYDKDGNVVNVNSWLECANYVNGGWTDYIGDFTNGEQYLFIAVTFLLVTTAYLQKKHNFLKRI